MDEKDWYMNGIAAKTPGHPRPLVLVKYKQYECAQILKRAYLLQFINTHTYILQMKAKYFIQKVSFHDLTLNT